MINIGDPWKETEKASAECQIEHYNLFAFRSYNLQEKIQTPCHRYGVRNLSYGEVDGTINTSFLKKKTLKTHHHPSKHRIIIHDVESPSPRPAIIKTDGRQRHERSNQTMTISSQ